MAAPAEAFQLPPSCSDVQQQHDFRAGCDVCDDDADLFLHPFTDELLDDIEAGGVGENADVFEQLMSLATDHALLEQKEEALRLDIAHLLHEGRTMEEVYEYYKTTTAGAALVNGHLVEVVDESHAIVTTDANNRIFFYVRVLDAVDRELLKPDANVVLCKSSLAVVGVLPLPADDWWVEYLAVAGVLPADDCWLEYLS